MAYFCNGSEGTAAESGNCDRCVHQEDSEGRGCRVTLLHLMWNYKAVGKNGNLIKQEALNTLWPMTADGLYPGRCGMFFEKRHEPASPPAWLSEP